MVENEKMNTNKRLLSLLLAIVMLLSSLPFAGITAFADSIFQSGDYNYRILNDGTAEITSYSGYNSSITIPSKLDGYTVTSLADNAFSYTTLESITIPKTVTNIGSGVFYQCWLLNSINVVNDNKSFSSVNGVLFSKDKSVLIRYPMGNEAESYSIPNGTTKIATDAFIYSQDLTNISIPDSVNRIEHGAFHGTGYYDDESNWSNGVLYIGKHLIYAEEISSGSYSIKDGTITIADDAFKYCSNEYGDTAITNITIPNSVKSIGDNAFSGTDIKNISIPNSVKYIGAGAFLDCMELTNVTIPSGITSILEGTFANCWSLASVTIPNSVKSIGEFAFSSCSGLKNVYYAGSKEQWNKVSIAENNGSLIRATMHYNNSSSTSSSLSTPKISSVSSTATGIKITWGKVSGAAKYRVFYKTGNGKWTKLTDTTSTSYTWTKAKSNTKYTFTVRCISKDGKSYTSDYNKTGKSIKYIAAPKLSSVASTTTGIKISWGKVVGAAKYRIFYKTGNGKWKKLTDTTSTSYTWKKAKSGTKYSFTVRCISKDGKSYTSAYDTKGKSITFISAPKISKLSKTSSGIKISWGKVAGAAKYRIFYKTANGKWKKLTDTTSTSYTWKGAKKGTTYSFTVRCISKDGKTYTSAYDTKGKSIKR